MSTLPQPGSPAPHLPPTRVGAYQIERELGRGAAAVVYRARTPEGNRVALKMLTPAARSDPRVWRAFEREIRLMTRIRDPRVVRLHETGSHEGLPYFTMDYVEGETLADMLLRVGKLGETPAIEIALQIAAALGAIHALGIVHRDIKPGNLLVAPAGRLYLFDFGTALDIRQDQPTPGSLYGTPGYIAPEQARGLAAIDARADLYSLGVLLYRMVTGRKPFYGSRDEVLEAHISLPPPSPANFAHLSDEMVALLLRALAKAPEDRFQDAAEFVAALEQAKLAPPPRVTFPQRLLDLLRGS